MVKKLSSVILEFVSENDREYLKSPNVGIEDYDDLNGREARSFILESGHLDVFFAIMHHLYEKVRKNNICLKRDAFISLKLFEDYYQRMNNISNILRKDIGKFSLDEEFSFGNGVYYPSDLNAVTVITPSQTVSVFNDNTENGLEGSGFHNQRILEIVKAVYAGNVVDVWETGQDIVIRYANRTARNSGSPFDLFIVTPYKVTLSQQQALENLNKQIKSFELKSGVKVEVYALVMNYDNCRTIIKYIECENNLDAVLDKVIINDSISLKYEEVNVIGYPNIEDHFNDSEYKLNSRNERRLSGDWENYGGEVLMGVSVYDFLTNVYSGIRGKMVIAITNKQCVTIAGYNCGYTHDNLSSMLFDGMFPYTSFNGFDDETTIVVFGTMYSVDFTIPSGITLEQYEVLSNLTHEIESFEKDYRVRIPYFCKDEILSFASSKIVSSVCDSGNEVIVGRPITSHNKVKSKK